MSKQNYTSGPWYIEEKNPDEFEITTGENGVEIAFVSIQPQSKENARLIAAAPDLLNQLISISNWVKSDLKARNIRYCFSHVDEAIKKALGE
jgi:hypothetical protein